MKHLLHTLTALLSLSVLAFSALADDGWASLKQPGATALFRHTSAPGIGDPPNFKAFECKTQRNLNEIGRAEARKLGEEFRSRKIEVGAVLSSQWCRTRDTARLAFGDLVRYEPSFNSSFLASAEISEAQTAQARAVLANWHGPGVLVVITHQVNITALTGMNTASGEGVVVTASGDGSLKVLGTISP